MTSKKRQIFEQLIYEIRRSQNATDRYDQAVADAVGVNRTDLRCLDVIEREGRVSAGRLADATGLTSGAITTVIDRLERAGYARRTTDPRDRRRVLVELTPRSALHSGRYYAEHAALGERLYRQYTLDQLELLLEFVRRSSEFNERKAAELEERTRQERQG